MSSGAVVQSCSGAARRREQLHGQRRDIVIGAESEKLAQRTTPSGCACQASRNTSQTLQFDRRRSRGFFSEWEWTSEKGAREGARLRSRCCAWGQHVPFLNARNHPQACVWEGASGQSILPVSVDTGRCARRLLPRATCPTLSIVNITEAGGTYLHV